MAYASPLTRRRLRHDRVTKLLSALIIGSMSAAFIVLIGVEIAVGCGQISYYPDGSWATNKCVWLNNPNHRSGEWEMQDVSPVHNYHHEPQGDTHI